MLTENTSSTLATRSFAWSLIGWLVAIASVGAVAALLILGSNRARTQPVPAREEVKVSERDTSEVASLKQAIAQLERKSAALEHKSSALEATVVEQSTSAKAVEPQDTRSAEEIHQAVLTELDVVLATDRGDPRERRLAADALSRDLSAASAGQARVVEVECATALCKAVIEEDTSARPELDTNTLVDRVAFLRRESMFGYERVGTRKRTIIYSAREGQSLAAARGIQIPPEAPSPR